jgi:dGTP triphosphohydrolase
MAIFMAEQMGWHADTLDPFGSVKPCSLLHDIGHPPLGHPGAHEMNQYFSNKGLKDGFCDNSNTLVVIDKNDIMVSPYTIASVIKYPDRLYRTQGEYLEMLKKALKMDQEHFQKSLF